MEIRSTLCYYHFEVFEIVIFLVMGLISLNRNKGECKYNTMLLIVFFFIVLLGFASLRAQVMWKMQGRKGEETYLEEK